MSKNQHELKKNTLYQSKFPLQIEEQAWEAGPYPDLNKVFDTASYDTHIHKINRVKRN